MTSQGHLPAEFAQACEPGNYAQAVALAAQLKPLSLVEALGLLVLIAEHEPTKCDVAAVRWHARWQHESLYAKLFAGFRERARDRRESRDGCSETRRDHPLGSLIRY